VRSTTRSTTLSLYYEKDLKSFRYSAYHQTMGSLRPIRQGPDAPVELQARAMDNLLYIRRTMERAGSFTAVPGVGGVFMGATAMAAAWIASSQPNGRRWISIWLGEAVLALLIGIVAAARKSVHAKIPLFSAPGRKFVAAFIPYGRGRAPHGHARPRRSILASAGRLATALWRQRGFRRRGFGPHCSPDGRLFHGPGDRRSVCAR
jgi:hypothetical protein